MANFDGGSLMGVIFPIAIFGFMYWAASDSHTKKESSVQPGSSEQGGEDDESLFDEYPKGMYGTGGRRTANDSLDPKLDLDIRRW